jgi:2-polyprenyl-3-methyl-5-hydroxy-6-metoxy-1,4-benzoquinol methylase
MPNKQETPTSSDLTARPSSRRPVEIWRPRRNLASTRYEWALATLEELGGSLATRTVLDVGAGDGRMRTISELGLEWRGYDLAPADAETARWDLADPFPEMATVEASVALLLDVIEHCCNPGTALKNVSAALKPGAFLLLTTPNMRNSRSRVGALRTGFPLCFTQGDLDTNHHVFPAWPHVLCRMLDDADFEIVECVTLDGWTSWPRRPLSLSYPLRCVQAVLTWTIERFDRSACGMSYGVLARRLPPAARFRSHASSAE